MIWFIDIDGCLCDNRDEFIKRCSAWLDNNMILHSSPVTSEYLFSTTFNVDKELAVPCFESEEFAGYYITEPADGAVEFLQSIDKSKDMIVMLTGRNPDDRIPITEELHAFLGCNYDNRKTISIGAITKRWLDRYEVPYDNIIFRQNKVEFIEEFRYSAIAIEDDPRILEGYITNNIPCIAMRADYNEGIANLEADSWFDIHRMVQAGLLDN